MTPWLCSPTCASHVERRHCELDALAERQRVPRRAWLEAVLRDIADGSCSVLERGYLQHVERAHGRLPRADRQVGGEPGLPSIYGMSGTPRGASWSSWTAACSTTRRRRGTPTSTATSSQRSND
jgi:hypothetical protein